jgi:hypothetical protein
MSTAREIREFVSPFLERHPELHLHKRRLFRAPIQHCMVGISFDAPHYRGDVLVSWYVGFLFAPPPRSGGGFRGSMDRAWGVLGDHGLQERAFAEMERVLQEIISVGTSIENAIEVNRHAPQYFGEMTPESHALLLSALGRFSEAQAILQDEVKRNHRNFARACATGLKGASESNPSRAYGEWLETIANLEKLLGLLDDGEPSAIAALLHKWEALGVQQRGIERYWEPSPFPFELS